jgi:Spy/CpxP family protein refolding chaperone
VIGSAGRAKLLVAAVFLVGAVTGALIQNVYVTRLDAADSAPEKKSQKEVNQTYDLLGLNAQQRQQWTSIMRESRPEFMKLVEENRKLTAPNQPKFDALQEQTRSKIRAILTEEQKKMYNDINERRRQRQSQPRPRTN